MMLGSRCIPNVFFALLVATILVSCQIHQLVFIETTFLDHDRHAPTNTPLPTSLAWLEQVYQGSHFVELDHCSLESIPVSNFSEWALGVTRKFNNTSTGWRDEWTLQLLELYALHAGLCNFSHYRPRIPQDVTANAQIRKIAQIPSPPGHSRIAFTIVAYQDVQHLQRLIEAIHMPHHYIVIHLEESTPPEFQIQVQQIANRYENVVLRQFGTILYKTDSVSRVQLQLMSWLVQDLQVEYDYHITLGGAVYPLWNASALAQNLKGNVYMGELTHNGMQVHHPQWAIFWKKRLLSSKDKESIKVGFLFDNKVPDWIDQALQHKATSGNQAVYSRHVVHAMLQSEQVMYLFALAKYGCCCCIEERSWIAAMHLLGFGQEAKQQRSVLQLWGGDSNKCKGSMSNVVLDLDQDRCYRQEDPLHPTVYIWGNETWSHLMHARASGVLFARKFHSSHAGSVVLMERIRQEMHV